jgi:hypothetical protein
MLTWITAHSSQLIADSQGFVSSAGRLGSLEAIKRNFRPPSFTESWFPSGLNELTGKPANLRFNVHKKL